MDLNSTKKIKINNPEELEISYFELGEGETILFIPGGGIDSYYYKAFLVDLAKYFKVYAINLPGYLGSTNSKLQLTDDYFSELIKSILDELKISKANIAGHSMGGGIALKFSQKYPDRINNLFLVAPLIRNFKQWRIFFGARVVLSYIVDNLRDPQNYLPFLYVVKLNIIRFFHLMKHLSYSTKFVDIIPEQIKNKGIIFIGKQDLIFGYKGMYELLSRIPNVKLISRNEGHDIMFSSKDFVIEEIRNQINSKDQ